MTDITVADRAGRQSKVTATPGVSLMENLRSAGYDDILALCGGNCSCATCHVVVGPEWADTVGQPTEDEKDLLLISDHYVPNRSRLSCQILVGDEHDGLDIAIAPED
ncbi:2Fe-2S iron-sulfur cluster-binding protein [Streptomyces solisilvae]|uniref:2Fe-2S iron-sulfur cluster-binding protein n=1 Tax=Streptomyces malaysiensis TaxID=92644 RepID=UPI0036D08922